MTQSKNAFAFVITSFVLLTQTASAEILNCSFFDGGLKLQIQKTSGNKVSLKAENTAISWETGEKKTERASYEFTPLGRVNLGYTWGDLKGKDPFVALVDTKAPGHSYAALSLVAGSNPNEVLVEIALTMGDVHMTPSGVCQKGKDFKAFAKNSAKLKMISRSLYNEYRDPQLAFVCAVLGTQVAKYKIRAIGSGSIRSSVQVQPVDGDDFGFHLDSFTEVKGGVRYEQAETTITYPPKPKSASFQLKFKPKKAKNGKLLYQAEFFDGAATESLSCSPRWSVQKNIIDPVIAAREIPKQLPPPGTAAQIDPKKCGDYKAIYKVFELNTRLIMAVPNVNGMNVTEVKAENSSTGTKCYMINVMVDKGMQSTVQSILGESFYGYGIVYEAAGRGVLQ